MKRKSRDKNYYSLFMLHNSIKAGFTLIEMLVVISIIGLLATLSLTSFTTAQKQAKDTQRKSDLKQYVSALTGYAAKNGGFYPSRTGVTPASEALFCTTDLGLTTCPKDPKDPTKIYSYFSDGADGGGATATTYVLWATLDSVSSTTYWITCSNGKSGTSATVPASGTCPL